MVLERGVSPRTFGEPKDGPAIECTNGYKAWHLNGVLHREDGPAIDRADGFKAWYLNGKALSEEERFAQTTLVKRAL